jgi:hypothetical protein
MLQPATLPESLLDRAKRLREEMAIQKQYARKKQKREQSKLRYNRQREEILIEKKQAYQIHRDEKVQQQKEYNKKNLNKVNARQRKYDEKHRDEKAERQQKYNNEHRDEVNARQKLYDDENKEKKKARKYEAAEAASNSAKKRKTAVEDDKSDIESFLRFIDGHPDNLKCEMKIWANHQKWLLSTQCSPPTKDQLKPPIDWFKDRYERSKYQEEIRKIDWDELWRKYMKPY